MQLKTTDRTFLTLQKNVLTSPKEMQGNLSSFLFDCLKSFLLLKIFVFNMNKELLTFATLFFFVC